MYFIAATCKKCVCIDEAVLVCFKQYSSSLWKTLHSWPVPPFSQVGTGRVTFQASQERSWLQGPRPQQYAPLQKHSVNPAHKHIPSKLQIFCSESAPPSSNLSSALQFSGTMNEMSLWTRTKNSDILLPSNEELRTIFFQSQLTNSSRNPCMKSINSQSPTSRWNQLKSVPATFKVEGNQGCHFCFLN